MAGHTKGPWNVYRHFAAPEGTGYDVVGATRDDDVAQDLTEANARLIAAAPDLLEALEGLIAVCEPNIYPQPDKPESSWAKLQAAKSALSRATGGVR